MELPPGLARVLAETPALRTIWPPLPGVISTLWTCVPVVIATLKLRGTFVSMYVISHLSDFSNRPVSTSISSTRHDRKELRIRVTCREEASRRKV